MLLYISTWMGCLLTGLVGLNKKFPNIPYETFCNLPQNERDLIRLIIDSDENFYANLKPFMFFLKLLTVCQINGYDTEILTSVGEEFPEIIKEQKLAWIHKHVGKNIKVNFVNKSSEKARFAHPNAILLDDRDKSIDPFIEAGGIAYKVNGLDYRKHEDITCVKFAFEWWIELPLSSN